MYDSTYMNCKVDEWLPGAGAVGRMIPKGYRVSLGVMKMFWK